MPLTSITKLYKTFPSSFAAEVTQHMRTRRESYRSGTNDNIDNTEELTGTNGTQSRTRNAVEEQRPLVSKPRSNTPLAAVSDNESDSENSSVPHAIQGRTTPTGAVKRESPRPITAGPGYFNATLDYFARPKLTRSSPRTAASLDQVDLWEDDDVSDTDDTSSLSSGQGYDRVNGVLINPRRTVDISIIRRCMSPVATKRNRIEGDAHVVETPSQQLSNITAESRSKYRDPDKYARDPRAAFNHVMIKPRVRGNRRSPSLQASPRVSRPRKDPSPGGAANRVAADGKQTAQDHGKTGPRGTGLKNTYSSLSRLGGSTNPFTAGGGQKGPPSAFTTGDDSLPRIDKSTPRVCIATHKSPLPRVKVAHDDGHYPIRDSLARNSAAIGQCGSQSGTPKIRTPSVKPPMLVQRRPAKEAVDVKSSGSDSGESATALSTSPDRKVKFNNFVHVRDGDVNTTDALRESHNSAQMFKQKFLGGPHSRPVRNSHDSNRDDGVATTASAVKVS